LAARGVSTRLLEAADAVGGKAGTVVIDGVEADTGPSVLTLPDVFDALLRRAGTSLDAELELVRPSPAFRYLWPDGASVDLQVAAHDTLASVHRSLGADAGRELEGFLRYAARIWDVAGPRFVRGPAPTVGAMLSWSALRDLAAIDPLRSMARAIDGRVREPHLRDILRRYATYAGSDPRRAPATLNCIAHVELGLGGFGVLGGIARLVRALVAAATAVGVELYTNCAVERIGVADGRVTGVVTAGGFVAADIVVSNAEVAHLFGTLCDLPRAAPPTSTSGWTGIVRGSIADRAAHTVVFPETYGDEFVDLFDRHRTPADPTVYVCAQRICHGRASWPDAEPLFAMVNAPPVDQGEALDPERVSRAVLARMRAFGLCGATDPIVWSRTPRELAARFPGSAGALYGTAHDGPTAAIRRTGNRVRAVRGLYVASGSAHPGGGLPLAALSGRAAAAAALEDRS
ncbi:MAG: FAD-dependent oxidoreductase, partial [Myxococcota bacterium]